jgi:hypothetical protein
VGGNINITGTFNTSDGVVNSSNPSGFLALHVGGFVKHTIASNYTQIWHSLESTASNNGALVVAGGTGIGGNLRIGGEGYKPAGTTWVTTSDERIKENIQDADLSICNNIVKNLKLKYYKYKDEFVKPEQRRYDNHQLGFIAQEVKQLLPKSVPIQEQTFKYTDENGEEKEETISDLHYLDKDQILMSLYGCVQYLQKENEQLKKELEINKRQDATTLYELNTMKSEIEMIKTRLGV